MCAAPAISRSGALTVPVVSADKAGGAATAALAGAGDVVALRAGAGLVSSAPSRQQPEQSRQASSHGRAALKRGHPVKREESMTDPRMSEALAQVNLRRDSFSST